jgi:hypothetical protein
MEVWDIFYSSTGVTVRPKVDFWVRWTQKGCGRGEICTNTAERTFWTSHSATRELKDPDLVPLSEDNHSTARISSQVREHWRTTGAECFFALLFPTFPPSSIFFRQPFFFFFCFLEGASPPSRGRQERCGAAVFQSTHFMVREVGEALSLKLR